MRNVYERGENFPKKVGEERFNGVFCSSKWLIGQMNMGKLPKKNALFVAWWQFQYQRHERKNTFELRV